MKKKLFLLLLAALLAVALPLTASAASSTRYVKTSSGSNVRLRSGPGTDYQILDHVPYGAKVQVYSTFDGWCEVNYNGRDGFIASRLLSKTKPGSSSSSGSSGTKTSSYNKTGTMYSGFSAAGYYATVTPSTPGNFVNMRWAPSQSMPVLAKYYADQSLYVLKQNSGWCQVYDQENNRIGFMQKSFLTKAEAIREAHQ